MTMLVKVENKDNGSGYKTVVETVDRFNGETDIAKRDILEAGESVEIYLTDSRSLNISEKSGD